MSRYGDPNTLDRFRDPAVSRRATLRYWTTWRREGPAWDVRDNDQPIHLEAKLAIAIPLAALCHQHWGDYGDPERLRLIETLRHIVLETGDNMQPRIIRIARVHDHEITIDNRVAIAFHNRVIAGQDHGYMVAAFAHG